MESHIIFKAIVLTVLALLAIKTLIDFRNSEEEDTEP